MKTIADLLEEHPFFGDLQPEALELIAGCGLNVHFADDERMLSEGEPADNFFVLRTGKVAIEVNSPQSGPLVIETIGPGEILGVSWFMPPYRSTFDARAVEATTAVSIDAACLRGKCDEDTALGYELFKRFAGLVYERLQAARLQLLDVYRHK
jgi:CRP/FNR family cyclic AMP-dependent transcriptional regulator